jgi:hypothetical protein
MNFDDFFAEANRLAKPSRQYRFAKNGEPISGYWHGIGAGGLCISVERRGQWMNVYLDEEYKSGRVELSPEPLVSDHPLCRSDAASLPPIDAVFRFGSSSVEKYLEANGWKRDWGFNNNFKGAIAHEYEREWAKQCPLYAKGVVALEGGWNMPWPDDDWEDLLGHEFVLWTFEDSEPWVEVFSDGTNYRVIQRIT